MKPMHAIVLAAGKARRLYPLCNNQPLCLLRVAGKPIIRYIVSALRGVGVNKITVVTGHFAEHVRAELGSEVEYIYNPYFAASSDLVTLWCSRKIVQGPFMFLYGDLLFQPSLLVPIVNADEDVRLGYIVNDYDLEAEKVSLSEGWVRKIGKNIAREDTAGEYIGVSAFSNEAGGRFFRLVSDLVEREGHVNMPTTSALQRLVDKEGCQIKAINIGDARWMEIDVLADYEAACREAVSFVGQTGLS